MLNKILRTFLTPSPTMCATRNFVSQSWFCKTPKYLISSCNSPIQASGMNPCMGSLGCLSRQYSHYVVNWEKMRRRRPRPPKDDTRHLPDYMHQKMPNQEDTVEAREITTDVINRVNNQILERSHGRLFAVIAAMGKQFKITAEDIIILQGTWAPTIGDRIRLEKVLLVGSSDFTLLGRPMLPRDLVRVEATVIEKTMSYTKFRFLLIKRKNFRRLKFIKDKYTMLRINKIEFDGLVNEKKEVEGVRNTII